MALHTMRAVGSFLLSLEGLSKLSEAMIVSPMRQIKETRAQGLPSPRLTIAI